MHRLLLGTALVGLLACSGGGDSAADSNPPIASATQPTPESATADNSSSLVEEPTEYDSTLDTTVAGKDDDLNGIRDDIDDALDNALFHTSPNQHYYLVEYAKVWQQLLLSSNDSMDEVQRALESVQDCLTDSGIGVAQIELQFVIMYLNTPARQEAYMRYEDQLDNDWAPKIVRRAEDFNLESKCEM